MLISMAFPVLISIKLTNTQLHYVQISNTEFHTNWEVNVEVMGRKSSMPVSVVWPSASVLMHFTITH